MLFNSLQFLLFLPAVLFLYYIIKPKHRWILLLIASYYFYMCWRPEYIILIIISTIIDYFAARRMEQLPDINRRKKYLYLSLVSNLGILFFFKYFNFFSESTTALFQQFNIFVNFPAFNYLLPVGISFYTFQTLSYTIDVYKGDTKVERHFGRFALYVSFFPQLVAGPIERSYHLLPQLRKHIHFNYEWMKAGVFLMLWGFLKKVVIADRLAAYVNEVYNNVDSYSGIPNILATYFFAFQIYCDFSGYSDIAIGCALMLGIQLMKNFERPYFALNIQEFWKRWHISLSTWFKDYVYIPLGGNRVVKWRWYYNLFITFLVSGLWHGANWTFVIWGALHGLYILFYNMMKEEKILDPRKKGRARQMLNRFFTFHIALLAWVFFRANHLGDVDNMIIGMFQPTVGSINLFTFKIDLYLSILFIGLLVMIEWLIEHKNLLQKFEHSGRWMKWLALIVGITIILLFGVFEEVDFLYFQF
ncbi:MAG: MBOAT family O-acyltransferase [Chitinophagales bacterium]